MTYASSASLIWCGFGSFAVDDFGRGVSRSSSSMISWQRLMHSSQMYTPWPAISFRTCSWLFPQNEQRYGTLGPLDVLLVVTEIACSWSAAPAGPRGSYLVFLSSCFAASSVEGFGTPPPSPPARPRSCALAISESPVAV